MSLVPPKKQKLDTDFKLCFICQKTNKSKHIVQKQSTHSVERVIGSARERQRFKVGTVGDFVEGMDDIEAQDIISNNGFYHRHFVRSATNIVLVERAESRFKECLAQSSASLVKRNSGRPSVASPVHQKEEDRRNFT